MLKSLLPAFLLKYLKSVLNAARRERFIRKFKRTIAAIHREKGQAIVIMATPVHGNLGDHAIVYAEKCLLGDMGLAGRIVEIANSDYALCKKGIKKFISDRDLILIDGGGNLGTLWPWEDDKISEIIATYQRNPIVIFPQTCFYEESSSAQERLKRNAAVYAKTGKLLISLRDKKSHTFCCTRFNACQFVLVPDIVLYLYGKIKQPVHAERNGILLCFRKDLERMVSHEETIRLKSYLLQQKLTYRETSTVKDYGMDHISRQTELNKLWSEFASAGLVITDRLHGMIFAAINGTPCLALDNVSRKVSGVYELIPNLESIKICANMNEVIANVASYYNHCHSFESTSQWRNQYLPLQKFIKEQIQD